MAYMYRDDFPLLKSQDVAYLDNAATAQRPQCVLDAVAEFYKSQNANPLRGLYPLSIAATEAYENAREAVRSFLNAKSSREIIFTRNTTESINLVAYSYGLSHVKAGDEVLVSIMEHHSDLLPWQMVCRQTGATLKFMECEMDGTLDLNKVEALITPKTKIVACTHVSNVLGRVYLLGSVSNAVWIGKTFYGTDVREHGSHNAGATNTMRILGRRAGIAVFVLDFLKGFIAVSLAALLPYAAGSPALFNMKFVLTAAVVLGHIFPLFAGFRGGKGLA